MDILLDSTTHDLAITNNGFALTDKDDDRGDLRQQIMVRLLTFQGEWFLDTTAGLPYYQTIFQKGVTKAVVDNIIRRAVEQVEGITKIERFTSTLNNATRDYTCTFVARADDGQTLEVTL